MKCLVTGGAGFIGSHLCDELLKRGHSVVCVDNMLTGNAEYVKNKMSGKSVRKNKFVFQHADVNDFDQLFKIFKRDKFDWVFHHAAMVGVKRTLEQPLGVLNDIKGIQNVLEMSRKTDVKKVLFASSSEVYGEPVEIPEVENGHMNPKLPYAVVKLMGEQYFKAYNDVYGISSCSLRFFNVYGPRQTSSIYGFVVGMFINRVLKNKPPIIYGDGTQTRDFVYINDNIQATLLAMEKRKTNGESINIGTGRPMTILDLAERVIKLSKKNIKPIFRPARDDVRHRFPDISKMIAHLKFRPNYDIDKGLQETINWYKKTKIKSHKAN